MEKNRQYFKNILIIIFIAVALFIGGTGYIYIDSQNEAYRKQKENYLTSIAEFKAEQIGEWFERIDIFINHVMTSSPARVRIANFIKDPSLENEKTVLYMFKTAKLPFGYNRIFICNEQEKLLLTESNNLDLISPGERSFCAKAAREKRIIFSDIYKNSLTGKPQLSYHIPVSDIEFPGKIIGAVSLIIDPEDFLYPLIKKWPVKSNSGETFIARHLEENIVYLTQLRFIRNSALNFTLPDTLADLPAYQGAHGKEGIVDGKDYRQVKVLAAVKKIPNSNWFIVAKEDTEEIFYESKLTTQYAVIIIFILISMAGIAIGFVWNGQGKQYYRKLYHTEEEKRLLTAHLENLTKYANDIIVLFDSSGKIIQANNKAVETYGYSEEEFFKLNALDLVAPQRKDQAKNYITKLAESSEGVLVESDHVKKDGTSFPIENSARRIIINDNIYIQAIIRDITERKKAEKVLAVSEKQYRELFETTSDLIQIISPEGKIIFVNKAWKMTLGYDDDDLKNISIDNIVHPDFLDQCLAPFQRALAGEKIGHIENRLITKSGGYIDVDGSITCNYDTGGSQRITCFLRDITKRKKAEQKIKETAKKNREIVEGTKAILFSTNTRGQFTFLNEAACEILGMKENELINQFYLRFVHPECREEVHKTLYNQIIDPKPNINVEIRVIGKTGKDKWLNFYINPVFDNKKLIGLTSIALDITEKKKMIKELIDAKEKAEEMNRVKNVFFANMSHELRTPFVGIMGYAELLLSSLTNHEEKEMVKGIQSTSNRMLNTLTKILNISKLESDKSEISYKEIDIIKIIEKVYNQFAGMIKQKNLGFTLSSKFDSFIMLSNENILSDILNNLVDNAVVFTDTGSIDISVELKINNAENFIKIIVTDSGIGISKEMQKVIFEAFRQVSEGTTRNYQGTGLGLTIVKKSVEMLGGNISLISEVGKGTTFIVELPV